MPKDYQWEDNNQNPLEEMAEVDIAEISYPEDALILQNGQLALGQRRKYDTEHLHVVVFRLGNSEYVMDLAQVEEIIRPNGLIKMAGSPAYIEGLLNLRGRIVPIINLARQLGFELPPATSETCVIVTKSEMGLIGLMVDAATEIMTVRTRDFEVPSVLFAGTRHYLQGVAHYGERLLVMLDLTNLFLPNEQRELLQLNNLPPQAYKQLTEHHRSVMLRESTSTSLSRSHQQLLKAAPAAETLYAEPVNSQALVKKQEESEEIRRLVAFELSGELYGVHITDVTEIRELLSWMPLPNLPEHILGLINLRGAVLPVIDLRRKFGLYIGSKSSDNRLIVLKGPGYQVALMVDAVHGLVRLPKRSFQPPPPGVVKIDPEYYEQVVMLEKQMLTELNVQKMLLDTAAKASGDR